MDVLPQGTSDLQPSISATTASSVLPPPSITSSIECEDYPRNFVRKGQDDSIEQLNAHPCFQLRMAWPAQVFNHTRPREAVAGRDPNRHHLAEKIRRRQTATSRRSSYLPPRIPCWVKTFRQKVLLLSLGRRQPNSNLLQ